MSKKNMDTALNAGTLAAEKIFAYMIKETGGDGTTMIVALAAIAAQMETQSPGSIDDIAKGARLMVDLHAAVTAGDMVADLLGKISKSVN